MASISLNVFFIPKRKKLSSAKHPTLVKPWYKRKRSLPWRVSRCAEPFRCTAAASQWRHEWRTPHSKVKRSSSFLFLSKERNILTEFNLAELFFAKVLDVLKYKHLTTKDDLVLTCEENYVKLLIPQNIFYCCFDQIFKFCRRLLCLFFWRLS